MCITGCSKCREHLGTHLKLLFPVIELHVQTMRSIPVPVDNVCLAIPIKVCKSNPSAMLHGVLQTYRIWFNIVFYNRKASQVYCVWLQVSILQGLVVFKVYSLPACCATSVKVPSPLFLKRKLGPYSLSQNTSDRLWLTMGPTTTPRPPAQTETKGDTERHWIRKESLSSV